MGDPDLIFGARLIHDKEKGILSLDQTEYIDIILKDSQMNECSTFPVPIDKSDDLEEGANFCDLNTFNKITEMYRRIIGRIMYLMIFSRPDLAYALSALSRYSTKLKVIIGWLLKNCSGT